MIWSKKARLQAELEVLLKTKQDLSSLPIDTVDKDMYYSNLEYEILTIIDDIEFHARMRYFRVLIYIFILIALVLATLVIINNT